MLKYAKIINEETKLCEVGLGTNTKFYQSIGMTEMDVEQAYDGSWYVKGYCPEKPQELVDEEIKQIRNSMLESVEWRVVRAREQKELGLKTIDNYEDLMEYKQYLRDYPNITENWWEQNPLEFEEWKTEKEIKE